MLWNRETFFLKKYTSDGKFAKFLREALGVSGSIVGLHRLGISMLRSMYYNLLRCFSIFSFL